MLGATLHSPFNVIRHFDSHRPALNPSLIRNADTQRVSSPPRNGCRSRRRSGTDTSDVRRPMMTSRLEQSDACVDVSLQLSDLTSVV